MANKDPAVLFYTSDFLGGVALMTMKERGQYITLLCLQRERGHMTRQEIAKAVGKLTPEVLSKFVQDNDGKLYNARMEKEIEKRTAHCRKQKENIEKRWNKPNDGVGNSSGNTVVSTTVDTTVLPLGNGNGITVYKTPVNLSGRDEGTLDAGTPPLVSPPDPVSAVLAEYLHRINPTPSQSSLDELRGYAEQMGAECCLRAFDVALDAKKANWLYIRGILRSKLSQGVRSLADWDALEARRGRNDRRGEESPSFAEIARRMEEEPV